MKLTTADIFAAALSLGGIAACGPLACDREERGLRTDPANVETVAATRTSGLYPGPHALDPSELHPTLASYGPHATNAYEKNAYALSEGKRFYDLYNCRGCHSNGGGGMGPPLMDDQWIYGAAPEQVVETM